MIDDCVYFSSFVSKMSQISSYISKQVSYRLMLKKSVDLWVAYNEEKNVSRKRNTRPSFLVNNWTSRYWPWMCAGYQGVRANSLATHFYLLCEIYMKFKLNCGCRWKWRGGQGFESRWSPDIFQASSFHLLKLENLLRWSFFTFTLILSLLYFASSEFFSCQFEFTERQLILQSIVKIIIIQHQASINLGCMCT